MGNQGSSAKRMVVRWGRGGGGSDSKKGAQKVEIGILAFEVASATGKAVQLWKSLSDSEMLRLRTDVIKSEGVCNLISDDEVVLLSLACIEKLQDLTAVALAVARLGKRCLDPALQGFEHVYDDILKQNIDARELAFSRKEMDAKVKKMERYIVTTTNLYLELEALLAMEQALRRAREEEDPAQKENTHALEQKVSWQLQEIRYLKEVSLWSRTYDKFIGILAHTVCTNYRRIVDVFGFILTDCPRLAFNPGEDENQALSSSSSPQDVGLQTPNLGISQTRGEVISSNGSVPSLRYPNLFMSLSNGILAGAIESYKSFCFSPGRQFSLHGSFREDHPQLESVSNGYLSNGNLANSGVDGLQVRSSDGYPLTDFHRTMETTPRGAVAMEPLLSNLSQLLAGNFLSSPFDDKGRNVGSLFDPKSWIRSAPANTLGGSALALHYANVILIIEKMAKYPRLISPESREDLYQMLPKSLRNLLRVRLRSCAKACGPLKWDGGGVLNPLDWRETLERPLNWLAPLAHNMIRWQAEHNIAQQNMVPRTNVLLLQTLFFADQKRTEAAIADLIVGLNHMCRYEQDIKAHALVACGSVKGLDEYLEWQLQ